MRNLTAIFTSAALLGLIACESKEAKDADSATKELNHFIDSIRNVTPEYSTAFWPRIDQGYQMRVGRAEIAAKEEAQKNEVKKSKEAYYEIKTKYDTEYQRQMDQAAATKKQAFRDALFGEGKIMGNDLSFSWVTAANIKDVYVNFVNTVEANKKSYTRQDWDEIKLLYEALDTRKNEVEKELPSKDNLKIAKEKIRFASIESVERPMAKANENAEAKEQDK